MKPMHARRAAPMVLGILGGLAGGKSTVAGLLAGRGAAVIDADRIGHQVIERPEVRAALRSAFGEQILDKSGRIERRLLARAAFGSPQRGPQSGPQGVDVLNGIVHPPILEEIRRRVEEIKRLKEAPLIVLDAALLVETGLDKELCEKLLYVDAPEDVRRRRARDERGIEPEQFEQRARAQASPEEKRKLADYVVTNHGSLEELDEQIGRLWTTLVGNSRQHGR
jgi:dephospho-CoA kinase